MKQRPLWLVLFLLLTSCLLTSCASPENGSDAPATEISSATVEKIGTNSTAERLPPDFDVQGHRGARGLKPENTLPAFETALDLEVTTLELDLHLTANGFVVIWHDDAIGGDKCGVDPSADIDVPDPNGFFKAGDALMISQLTLAQVQAYRCDRNAEPERFPDQDNFPTPLAGDDYRIPRLASLFEFVAAYRQSDLKFGREILKLVVQFALEDRMIIQSFDHRSLWAVRSLNENIRLAALTTGRNADIIGIATQGASIWSPRHTDLSTALVGKAHEVGLMVIPWTINDPADMMAFIDMGVDGIISDRPDILLELDQ